MPSQIPEILLPLLQEYTRQIDQETAGLVSALYLVGSIALDDFHDRFSDVDFAAVLSQPASAADFTVLQSLHTRLERLHPRWRNKVEGLYCQAADLGCPDSRGCQHLKWHDGRLLRADRLHMGAITWWILQNHGIQVFGPAGNHFSISIDWDSLARQQLENMNSYWASWARSPIRMGVLLSDWGVQWTVLGVLRQFFTLREHSITSKTGAAVYALPRVPGHFQGLIREAVGLRENPRQAFYRSRIRRAVDTISFLRYIIHTCSAACGADQGG
jgi:hypothetical protein